MHLLVVTAIAKFKFCQKVTKRGQKSFFWFIFLTCLSRTSEKAHGCRYTLGVCGLQINVSKTVVSCSCLAHWGL